MPPIFVERGARAQCERTHKRNRGNQPEEAQHAQPLIIAYGVGIQPLGGDDRAAGLTLKPTATSDAAMANMKEKHDLTVRLAPP